MQAINVTAVRPVFMTGLFGTAVACVALVVRGVRTWGDPWATLVLVGGGLYLIGTIGLTLAYHVPLNNGLAALDPDRAGAAAEWERYAKNWTRANHVRAAAALAAAAAYGFALTEPTTAGAG